MSACKNKENIEKSALSSIIFFLLIHPYQSYTISIDLNLSIIFLGIFIGFFLFRRSKQVGRLFYLYQHHLSLFFELSSKT